MQSNQNDIGLDRSPSRIVRNYVWVAILFSANYSCTLSCLALATARLGAVGAWQGGIFFLSYTASSLLGATYVAKKFGSRTALQMGMWVYAAYVGCFVVMELYPMAIMVGAVVGAIFGGMGRGLLVMAQGSYFGSVAAEYAAKTSQPLEDATSFLGGVFAGIFLGLEVLVRLAPTFLVLYVNLSWTGLFILYTVLSVVSAVAMRGVDNYPTTTSPTCKRIHSPRQSSPEKAPPNSTTPLIVAASDDATVEQGVASDSNGDDAAAAAAAAAEEEEEESVWRKATATLRLLYKDPKMKHLIWLNASFGFAGNFVNSFVNGTVVGVQQSDEGEGGGGGGDEKQQQPVYAIVGFLMAIAAGTAAVSSLFFGKAAQWWGKGPILILGGVAFILVALPFVLEPDIDSSSSSWTWSRLVMIYICLGIGRSTFEGTLRAFFADCFPHEKEGAFGNIVLQHGITGAMGYFLSVDVHCNKAESSSSSLSPYCVEFSDGSWHNVLPLELAVLASGVLSILGYWRVSRLRELELQTMEEWKG